MLIFNDKLTAPFIAAHERDQMEAQLRVARDMLDQRTGPGSGYTGWIDLPETMDSEQIRAIQASADRIRRDFDLLIVIGIGGSYLGARAVIEALSHHFSAFLPAGQRPGLPVLFAGHQLSADYLRDLIEVTRDKRVAINVISKSGRTTEPAIAFRVLRQQVLGHLDDDQLADRIFITTDREQGALRQVADDLGLTSFEIADDIGGRYSVLTPVGLLPIAVAGLDIQALLEGAREERARCLTSPAEGLPPCDRYAVNRILLNRKGYLAEMLAAYEPSMRYMTEWWKQLFGESEGKDGRGLIPLGLDYTTDLHSMGQLIQEGPRLFFETVVRFEKSNRDLILPSDPDQADELEYLAGTSVSLVNSRAAEATALAHTEGGVPNMEILLTERSARCLGRLIYFFERACALSALMNGVNPFDQPGVEAYKRNMFALLGKPGYEALRQQLES